MSDSTTTVQMTPRPERDVSALQTRRALGASQRVPGRGSQTVSGLGGAFFDPVRVLLLGLVALGASVLVESSAFAQGGSRGGASPRLGTDGPLLTYAGRPQFLFGQGDWLMVLKSQADYEAEAEWYQPYGANFTRVKLINTLVPDSEAPLYPWLRDGQGKFTLTEFNPSFWFRLRQFLRANEERGRFVLLQVFDEVGLERGDVRWTRHPFHPSLNVDDLGLPSGDAVPEFYSLQNASLRAVQEAYFDKLLQETQGFGNILYEVGNEYTGPTDWLDHWLARFTAFEAQNDLDLIVTNMSCGESLLQHEIQHPAIDVLDLWHAPTSLRNLSLPEIRDRFLNYRTSNKPLLTGRIGPEPDWTDRSPEDRVRSRTIFWTLLFSGSVGACTKEDDSGGRIFTGPPLYSEDTDWEDALGGLHSFLESCGNLSGLRVANGLLQSSPASLGLTLKTENGTAMTYLHEFSGSAGGPIRYAGLPNGQIAISFFDPATGFFLSSFRRTVRDGQITFNVPAFARDLAIVLDASGLTPRVWPTVTFTGATPLRMVGFIFRRSGIDPEKDDRRNYTGRLHLNEVIFERIPTELLDYTVSRQTFIEVFELENLNFAPGYYRIVAEVEDRSGNQGTCVVRFRIEVP